MEQQKEDKALKINIKRLNEKAKLPTRGSAAAAGYDLYAAIDAPCNIPPHSTIKIGTGISVELEDNTFGAIFARSGLATKEGLRPANCTGVIDSDYRGELIVALHNDTDKLASVEPGERIAQLVILPYYPIEFNEVSDLSSTDRGANNFGSTGVM